MRNRVLEMPSAAPMPVTRILLEPVPPVPILKRRRQSPFGKKMPGGSRRPAVVSEPSAYQTPRSWPNAAPERATLLQVLALTLLDAGMTSTNGWARRRTRTRRKT